MVTIREPDGTISEYNPVTGKTVIVSTPESSLSSITTTKVPAYSGPGVPQSFTPIISTEQIREPDSTTTSLVVPIPTSTPSIKTSASPLPPVIQDRDRIISPEFKSTPLSTDIRSEREIDAIIEFDNDGPNIVLQGTTGRTDLGSDKFVAEKPSVYMSPRPVSQGDAPIVIEEGRYSLPGSNVGASGRIPSFLPIRSVATISDVFKESVSLGKIDTRTFNVADLAKAVEINYNDISQTQYTETKLYLTKKGRSEFIAQSSDYYDTAYKDAKSKGQDLSLSKSEYLKDATNKYDSSVKGFLDQPFALTKVDRNGNSVVVEKEEFVKDNVNAIIDSMPKGAELAKEVGESTLPIYGTYKQYQASKEGGFSSGDIAWLAVGIGADILTLTSGVGALSGAARVSRAVSTSGRIYDVARAVPSIVIKETIVGPIKPFTQSPIKTVREIASPIGSVAGRVVDLSRIDTSKTFLGKFTPGKAERSTSSVTRINNTMRLSNTELMDASLSTDSRASILSDIVKNKDAKTITDVAQKLLPETTAGVVKLDLGGKILELRSAPGLEVKPGSIGKIPGSEFPLGSPGADFSSMPDIHRFSEGVKYEDIITDPKEARARFNQALEQGQFDSSQSWILEQKDKLGNPSVLEDSIRNLNSGDVKPFDNKVGIKAEKLYFSPGNDALRFIESTSGGEKGTIVGNVLSDNPVGIEGLKIGEEGTQVLVNAVDSKLASKLKSDWENISPALKTKLQEAVLESSRLKDVAAESMVEIQLLNDNLGILEDQSGISRKYSAGMKAASEFDSRLIFDDEAKVLSEIDVLSNKIKTLELQKEKDLLEASKLDRYVLLNTVQSTKDGASYYVNPASVSKSEFGRKPVHEGDILRVRNGVIELNDPNIMARGESSAKLYAGGSEFEKLITAYIPPTETKSKLSFKNSLGKQPEVITFGKDRNALVTGYQRVGPGDITSVFSGIITPAIKLSGKINDVKYQSKIKLFREIDGLLKDVELGIVTRDGNTILRDGQDVTNIVNDFAKETYVPSKIGKDSLGDHTKQVIRAINRRIESYESLSQSEKLSLSPSQEIRYKEIRSGSSSVEGLPTKLKEGTRLSKEDFYKTIELDERGRPIRATNILDVDGKVLLVKEKGSKVWSLPGGHVDKGESPSVTSIREPREELGITVDKPEYLFDHDSGIRTHKVYKSKLPKSDVKYNIQREEISDYKLWDGNEAIPVSKSTAAILDKSGYKNKSFSRLEVTEDEPISIKNDALEKGVVIEETGRFDNIDFDYRPQQKVEIEVLGAPGLIRELRPSSEYSSGDDSIELLGQRDSLSDEQGRNEGVRIPGISYSIGGEVRDDYSERPSDSERIEVVSRPSEIGREDITSREDIFSRDEQLIREDIVSREEVVRREEPVREEPVREEIVREDVSIRRDEPIREDSPVRREAVRIDSPAIRGPIKPPRSDSSSKVKRGPVPSGGYAPIGFRSGLIWIIINPPYKQEDIEFYDDKPSFITGADTKGPGSAQRTLQIIGAGQVPQVIRFMMGNREGVIQQGKFIRFRKPSPESLVSEIRGEEFA